MPSESEIKEALRRLKAELEHPAMAAAVEAPIGQEVEAAEAVLRRETRQGAETPIMPHSPKDCSGCAVHDPKANL